MFLSSRQRNPRRGVILLVVLALITLFASIGVAFVYFAEAEATKAQDQKAGETVKLPDADLMFNYVLRQLVFPTTNNTSALYTQSLLENMYGRTDGNTVQNVVPFNGTGWRANFDAATGQDNLYRRNMQGVTYNEGTHGSLNPTYTYPDHKNAYLAGVAANYRQPDYATHLPSGVTHGPVAIARSWAREMKFRVAIRDTASGTTVGYQEVILNPYSNSVFPGATGSRHQDFWKNLAFLDIGTLPALAGGLEYVPNVSIQCSTTGGSPVAGPGGARLMINAAGMANHTLRPKPHNPTGFNAGFSPPSDNGGDVKNLPPEVKTLVGFDTITNNPIFANNDSYWMDVGFPAMQWSNNRKVKPLVAMFIMDNDGKVNLNTAGNNRAMDLAGQLPYHASAHGLSPSEINPTKLTESFNIPLYGQPAITTTTIRSEQAAFIGGFYSAASGPAVLRGKGGYTSLGDGDPTTAAGTYPTSGRAMYSPIFRPGAPHAPFNIDGTYDGVTAGVWYAPSKSWQLSGEGAVVITDPLFLRFPYFKAPFVVDANGYYNGFSAGTLNEYQRGGVNRSPLFLSPFADSQPGNNADSGIGAGSQRTFGPQNHEELYRTRDSGGDKFNGELRKLIPSSYTTPQQRWQQTLYSNDLSVAGISPWFSNPAGDYAVPATAPNNLLTNGGAANSQAMPSSSVTTGDFFSNTNYSWRSIFSKVAGTTVNSFDRLDLSRQLPDYPLPANNNTQLDLTNPVVRAQYMIALQARQRMAREIYNNLKMLMQPNTDNGYRYIGQLAVNMVDYIDNDDYPTWFELPDGAATGAAKIVWGTELPRLVLNEVYVEAINHPGDPMPMNQAQNDYDVMHWAELYNPLMNSSYPGAWPASAGTAPNNLDSEARLNVGGTSVYRLIIAKSANSATTAIMRGASNTQGYPGDLTDPQTKVVYFPAGATVLPSDSSYGNGTTTNNNGFYLVGPGSAGSPTSPEGATTGPVVPPTDPLNFPTPQLSDTNMVQGERIPRANTPFTDNADNRSAILLQRLANPYLPHNPINDPTVIASGDTHNPALPYNPYITVDYVSNLIVQHAVRNNSGGPDSSYQSVADRKAYGKLQPYASVNETPAAGGTTVTGMWVDQRPDREYNTAGMQPLTGQPQHTFLRHNGVETDRSTGAPVNPPNPQPNTGGIAYSNTLRLPYDWLVHLDRTPTSPAELLHVSGFKPHELTQQFNRLTPVITATSSTATLAPGTAVTITATAGFIGQDHGTPYSLRDNDLVYVTWQAPAGIQYEWVLATAVNQAAGTFQTTTNVTATGVTGAQVQLVIPFAQYAPWYRALQNVNLNSSSRLYRFLETVAVRNPGVDVGQFRFTSNVPTLTAGGNSPNISAPLAPAVGNHSRWIQLDHGTITGGNVGLPNLTTTRVISTNDALLNIRAGDSVFGGELTPIGGYNASTPFSTPNSVTDTNYNVGDTVVINAGSASVNVPEQRATILEIDRARNCIRVVLTVDSTLAATAITEPLTIDYTYVSGRQPGKININTMWDRETFWALADAQPMNGFYGPVGNRDVVVDNVFTRLQQQRQPQYYYGPRMVGHTGFYGSVPEDRPFQGMGTGDITATVPAIPQQGIGNTFLSDRYQERAAGFVPYPVVRSDPALGDMTSPVGGDNGDVHRFTRTLFEIGNPGQDHPYRRFELLSKIWNNMTVRSNTFTVWMTIGFFEYDEANGLGAELGQIQGKNTRYRFFAVIDRTTIDRWLQNWALHDATAGINTLMDTNLFPNLDPRYATFPNLTAISPPGSYTVLASLPGRVNSMTMPRTVQATLASANPFFNSDGAAGGRMVYVESDVGGEYAQIITQTNTTIVLQLSLNHTGLMTIRPLPVPPTVLHWTQMK